MTGLLHRLKKPALIGLIYVVYPLLAVLALVWLSEIMKNIMPSSVALYLHILIVLLPQVLYAGFAAWKRKGGWAFLYILSQLAYVPLCLWVCVVAYLTISCKFFSRCMML